MCLVKLLFFNHQEPEFHWTSLERGVILSSFSWGLLFSPCGGLLATKFGGVKTFGLGICVTGLLTMVSPLLLKLNFFIYLVGRFMEGISEVCYNKRYIFWCTFLAAN